MTTTLETNLAFIFFNFYRDWTHSRRRWRRWSVRQNSGKEIWMPQLNSTVTRHVRKPRSIFSASLYFTRISRSVAARCDVISRIWFCVKSRSKNDQPWDDHFFPRPHGTWGGAGGEEQGQLGRLLCLVWKSQRTEDMIKHERFAAATKTP